MNNIVDRGANETDVYIEGPSAWSFSHNAWPKGVPEVAADAASLSGDPGFPAPNVAAGVSGFKPLVGSALRRAGRPVIGVERDYFGTVRSAVAPTIGLAELP